MRHGLNSIVVGKSYSTPDNEVRTVQSIDGDEVVFRAACGATPAMIARTTDGNCSLADFAAQVEAEDSLGV